MEKTQITHDIDQYNESSQVSPRKCNQIIFRNAGDVDAFISGIPLPAGEVNKDFADNFPGEVLVNSFELKFKAGTSATNKLVIVIRKYSDLIPANQSCKFNR